MRSGRVQHQCPLAPPLRPRRPLSALARTPHLELFSREHPHLPRPPPASPFRRRSPHRLQEGPPPRRPCQAPGQKQLAENVRQIRPHSPHRNGDQPAARVQGPPPTPPPGTPPDGLVSHEQGRGQLLPPPCCGLRRQSTLSRRPRSRRCSHHHPATTRSGLSARSLSTAPPTRPAPPAPRGTTPLLRCSPRRTPPPGLTQSGPGQRTIRLGSRPSRRTTTRHRRHLTPPPTPARPRPGCQDPPQ